MPNSLEALRAHLRRISVLSSVGSLVSYDEQVFMPPAATSFRAEQMSLLAAMAHEQFTSKQTGELLAAAEADASGPDDADARVICRETRRGYDRAVRLPAEFVAEQAELRVLSEQQWAEARKASNFAKFQPWLTRMIDLKRREAAYVGSRTGEAYDALLDEYEPDETAANIERVFSDLRPKLVEIVGRIVSSGRVAPVEILERSFPVEAQRSFGELVARAVGFDFNAGRLDVSVHPFCSGMAPGDTRMTTRYDPNSFADAFFGVLHETGHAMYEQGLPKEKHFGNPLAESISLGIHESQSRMWENLVGRSAGFWKFLFPKLRESFSSLSDVRFDQWMFAVNDVRASHIRVEADEATYNLHIMLRFELERAILAGQLDAADIPHAWNERFEHYLGIKVPEDRLGCLQDVHWSAGLIGYFPTYALGNLYAAQFHQAAERDLGDLSAMFEQGEFLPLLRWLRANIHQQGRRYSAAQLVQRITGRPLESKPLLDHLARKAQEYYGV